jgi:anaerobic ribonucleoside-triphosphate reductase activating protein
MKFQCAGVASGTVNGIGISLEVFFSGCRHNCIGCQNPELQNFSYGSKIDTNDILQHLEQYNDFYNSVVFLGGEPCSQMDALIQLVENIALPLVLYTGWKYCYLPNYIRNHVNVIVDGLYIEKLKTGNFPASSNQNIYINNILTKTDFRKNFYG